MLKHGGISGRSASAGTCQCMNSSLSHVCWSSAGPEGRSRIVIRSVRSGGRGSWRGRRALLPPRVVFFVLVVGLKAPSWFRPERLSARHVPERENGEMRLQQGVGEGAGRTPVVIQGG